MPDGLKKVAAICGYGAWFAFVFVSLTILTFPWSRVRDQVSVAASQAGVALTMGSLRPAWVGAKTRTLRVAGLGKDGPGLPWLELDHLKIKTGLFGALGVGRAAASLKGAPHEVARAVTTALGKVGLDAEGYGGSLDFDLVGEDELLDLVMKLESINLSPVKFKVVGLTMNPQGTLDGAGDIDWSWVDPKKSAGSLDLAIDGLSLALPIVGDANCTEAAAHLKIDRGRAEFRDTRVTCDIVQAELTGFLRLNKVPAKSQLALKAKFKLSDEVQDNGLVKAALRPDARHRDNDGWFHYQGQGTVERMRWKPDTSAGRSATRAPVRGRVAVDDPEEDVTPRKPSVRDNKVAGQIRRPVADPEERDAMDAERERLREERVRRREERRARREELLAKRRERQERIENGEELPDDGVMGVPRGDPGTFRDMQAEIERGEALQRPDPEDIEEEGEDEGGDEEEEVEEEE